MEASKDVLPAGDLVGRLTEVAVLVGVAVLASSDGAGAGVWPPQADKANITAAANAIPSDFTCWIPHRKQPSRSS